MKRLLTQITVLLITNLNLKGFITGTIYQGKLKNICVPGLNCYSCPGALGSCPIGALQAVAGSANYRFSFYVFGFMSLIGTLLGRFVCGWLCPFGLFQDLLSKIKVKKCGLPPRIDRILRMLKYAILLFPVLLLPMLLTNQFGISPPYFCQYICPSGTLMGGIPLIITNPSLREAAGFLFHWKIGVLLLFTISSLVLYRPFCKYICPLGAFYALFNRISLYRIQIDPHTCINCGACEKSCHMQVPVHAKPNHSECIRCGSCRKACPTQALSCGFLHNARSNKTVS